jgi:hypothetical protein
MNDAVHWPDVLSEKFASWENVVLHGHGSVLNPVTRGGVVAFARCAFCSDIGDFADFGDMRGCGLCAAPHVLSNLWRAATGVRLDEGQHFIAHW